MQRRAARATAPPSGGGGRLAAPLLLLAAVLLALAPGGCRAAPALVEHSLDSGRTFQAAGRIHLEDDAQGVPSGVFERQPITEAQLSQLRALVQRDGLYLWRVRLEGQAPVLTSIRAACLAEHLAGHRAELSLDGRGRIMAAALSVPAGHEPACSAAHALEALAALPAEALREPQELPVAVRPPAPAPSVPRMQGAEALDLAAAAGGAPAAAPASQQQQQQQQQQQAAQGAQGADGQGGEQAPPPPDNRTWWQKNWLFVMAGGTMVLNVALKAALGDVPPPGQGGAPVRPGQLAAGPAGRPGGGRR